MKKHTQKTLLLSITALIVCVALLAGTTMAWFTDSVSSGVNTITAGNLDIEVSYKDKENGKWVSIQDKDSLFSSNLWEPGHTEFVTLKIENKGTLALNYKVLVTPVKENGGVNVAGNSFKLSDYLVFGTTGPSEGEPTYTRETVRNAVGTTTGLADVNTLTKSTTMDPKDIQFVTLAVYMPESVGNDANYKTDTTPPTIELGIKVVATQKTQEEDSFGNDYDGGAVNDRFYTVGAYYNYFPQVSKTEPVAESGDTTIIATGKLNSTDTQDTTLAKVTVPANAVAEGTETLTVSVKPVEATNTDAQNVIQTEKDNGRETANFDIKVEGIDSANTASINVEVFVGKGLSNVKVYHNGTPIDSNYNPTTGVVTFTTTSFSDFTVAYDAAVAAIGDKTYGTLELAVAAAKAGETVTLLKDVEVKGQINLPVGVTLNGAGHAIQANNEHWSETNGSKMLLQIGTDATVKNVTLDSNKQACGVQAYAATRVTLENVILKNSLNAGLLVNASQVTVSGRLAMSGNKWGENDSNYINLAWGSNVTTGADKCTIDIQHAKLDGVSMIWTDKKDLSNAGVTQDNWRNRFAVIGDMGSAKQNDGIVWTSTRVAKIGNEYYASLADAISAVPDNGTETVITVLQDVKKAEGMAVKGGKNFVVDFAGHTYELNKPGAGSKGTETNGFQLLKDSKIIMKNGTITISKDNLTPVYGEDGKIRNIMRIIQNYSNLTLENMTIDGTNQYGGASYVMSFNNDPVLITGNTSIIAAEGKVAFDADGGWDGYDRCKVTIDTTGTIVGNIELARGELVIKNANVKGGIVVANGQDPSRITLTGGTFSSNPSNYVAKGYYIADTTAPFNVVMCKDHTYENDVCTKCGTKLTGANLVKNATIPEGATILKTQDDLNAALSAATADRTTTLYIGAGDFSIYTVDCDTKDITFVGAGFDQTKLYYGTDPASPVGEAGSNYCFEGSKVTFRDVTLIDGKGDDVNYKGFVRCAGLTFENCVLKSRMTYLGENGVVSFENCTFETPKYAAWIYSSQTYNFTNCLFNSPTGRFLNVYSEAKIAPIINATECRFVDSSDGSDSNAVFNIKTNAETTLKITDCVVTGASPMYKVQSDNGSVVTINGNVVYGTN